MDSDLQKNNIGAEGYVPNNYQMTTSPKAAAYKEQPSDQMSILAVIVHSEGTANSSGALDTLQQAAVAAWEREGGDWGLERR